MNHGPRIKTMMSRRIERMEKDSWDMLAVHVSDIICMLYLITVFLIWFDEGGIDAVARFGHGH